MQPIFMTSRLRRMSWRLVLAIALVACDPITLGSHADQSQQPRPTSVSPTPVRPTVLPAADLLENALKQRMIGEYDAAAVDFHTLITAYPTDTQARTARYYLAESFALRGRWSSAEDALRGFLAKGPQDDLYSRALFWLARCQEQAGAHADAVATYDQYRALKTPLEPYARLHQAAQLQALGQNARAADGYEAVAATDIATSERSEAYQKAIALRKQLGQNDVALQLYVKLLDLTDSPNDRAPILAAAAALAFQLGAASQGRAWLRELAERASDTTQALDAVTQLSADPQGGLAPAIAARVYDLHGQYAAAISSYDAAIAASSDNQALELRRLRALAQRSNGDIAEALSELTAISAAAPNSQVGRQAQLDLIQTRGMSGETPAAIDGYRQFARAYPNDQRAPEALNRAVILLGRLGDDEGVAQQQLDLGRQYPTSDLAHDALDQAGWHFYTTGRLKEAQDAWELLSKSASGAFAARGAFWAARAAQQNGQNDVAQKLFEAAISAAPNSYYGARASEILNRLPSGSIALGAPTPDTQWREAEDWIASWSKEPTYHIAEHGYPTDMAQSAPVIHAVALADVGLKSEAITEWNEARTIWRKDSVKLYLLARLADQHNTPYIALKAAEDLLALAPDKGTSAPEALLRLIFPVPYSEIIIAQAHEHQIDPRALYGLLRQESHFNPDATSWVGALGLAQVMPETGRSIAQNLGITDFQDTDLYRPAVSIRFGTLYLSDQLTMMNGNLQAAFSAYNGGPGNAVRWANGTTVSDADLFAESIDYEETRNYVKLVYGYYGAYRRLYKWP